MRIVCIIIFVSTFGLTHGQNKTDVSLFFKRDKIQVSEVQSKSGNLFNKLGHHGPAIENQWMALRMYFNQKTAIDLYSKSKPGLELREKQWYPSKEDQQEGWGADRYKVGSTVGLGGIKLWDGEALVDLKVDRQRRAIVVTTKDSSYMEMDSEGVPYKDGLIDLRVRVTVYGDKREAKVEAFSLSGEKVQFATGINYFKNLTLVSSDNYILTWGIHPEDVASTEVEVGAAIIYDKESFERKFDTGKQIILVSKASSYLQTWLTSANADEEEINSIDIFRKEVENLSQAMNQDALAQSEHKLDLKIQPEEIGDKISANLVERRFGWRYQKVCSYYGALIYADATNNKVLAKKIEDGYSPYLTGKRKPRKGHVDFNVFGIWPLELYGQTGNAAYLKMGKSMADHEYENPREDGLTEFSRFWVDDMYMVGSLQVQAYRSLKDQLYLDRAALLLVAYLDSLQKPNGLFYHRADAPHYWGRGNGWGAAAMAETLQELPENHKHYAALVNGYKKMMATLLEIQGDDGMWHQLLDKHDSFKEPSCTGMFLYAFVTGVDLGILPAEEYLPAIEKAWNTLAGDFVNSKGEVIDVCMWTNAKKRTSYYTRRPRITGDYHGQAAVLWATTALIKYLNE